MQNLPYLLIGILFIFALVFFAWLRQRDVRKVRERFKDILLQLMEFSILVESLNRVIYLIHQASFYF
jgi:hypothetical protein